MVKTFQQIQYCAIVEYQSPLTGDVPVVGVFYKQSWELMYHQQGTKHTIKVTPSQTCEVIRDCLGAILQEYMGFYADLTHPEEENNYSTAYRHYGQSEEERDHRDRHSNVYPTHSSYKLK